MPKISLVAHAKINLTLDVLGRRTDGFHEIESVMLPVSLSDHVVLEGASEISLETFGRFAGDLPDPTEDLAFRAAALLKARTGYAGGCAIRLQKTIPLAAGMGGGSSDAAAVLFGLNRLWGLELGRDDLLELSGELGSDVPFCLFDAPAIARGRGEILEPLSAAAELNLVLIKPPIPKSTGAVYRRLNLERLQHRPDTARIVKGLQTGDLTAVAGSLGNVLEPVLVGEFPEIGETISFLKDNGAVAARMTGAGPTVFGLFDSYDEVKKIAARAGQRFTESNVFAVQSLI